MKVIRAYHGTNNRFSEFEQSKARVVNDYYGGGVAYFTDTIDVAKSYASAMFRRNGGDKFVYEVSLRFDKIFDVDDEFSGETLKRLVGHRAESFARGAGLLRLGSDRIEVLAALKEGAMTLTGEQVFRGLSGGMVSTARAREDLIRAGYDGLRYNGGVNMGMATRHNVYLAYESNSIRILNRYIVSAMPVSSSEQRNTYTFIH